ncbi:helix-turn-helix transcriptional regulator [Pseudoxanthomonas composti]|uniref:helix-turn-helix transcriptional regulator n=1 Tax=Pseudoxanthomonas composti TaxID=2137479 RepID=UPI0013E992F8|nr:PAS domain-containing protein [Pseudoxanthomonas composti]
MTCKTASAAPAPDRLIEQLYGTFSDDLRMEGCLRLMTQVFGNRLTGIHRDDLTAGHASYPAMVSDELDAGALHTLARDYERKAPVNNLWSHRSGPGYIRQGYQYGEAVVSDAELLASPYYSQYLKPADIRYGMGICLDHQGPSRFTVMSFNRPPRRGPFGERDLAMVRHLRPHLVKLYAIHRRLARLEGELDTLRSTFDRVPVGMLLMDPDGRLLDCNAAAERLLQESPDVLRTPDGTLRFRSSRAQAQLKAAMARREDDLASPAALAMLIPSQRGQPGQDLVLHLCPLPPSAPDLLTVGGRTLGLLYALDDAGSSKVGLQVLQATLGLTRMEARVCMALRTHRDMEEVAQVLGVAISTVRSHLKHAFAKTGTSRQSELVLLVERLLSLAPR